MKASDKLQDAAIVQLLRALPLERLDGILEALGVAAGDREGIQRKADPRRCKQCSHGYVRCRALDEKAIPSERHEWQPDRSRADQ